MGFLKVSLHPGHLRSDPAGILRGQLQLPGKWLPAPLPPTLEIHRFIQGMS